MKLKMNNKTIDPWEEMHEQEKKEFLSKAFDEIWPNIKERFEWEKVYNVMKLLDWHWNDFGIPCVSKLQKTVYSAAKECWENKKGYASGGFTIGWEDDVFFIDFSIETLTVEMGYFTFS